MNARAMVQRGDTNVVFAAAGLCGVGTVTALGGLAAGQVPISIAGLAAAGTGFLLLAVTRVIDEMAIVMAILPLPALYADDALRITVAAPATAAAVLAWYGRRAVTHQPFAVGALPRRSGLAFIGALILATLFAVDPLASIRELINLLVLAAFLIAAVDVLVTEPARRNGILAVLVAVAGATGLAATLQAFGIIPGEFPRWGTSFYRASLGFGQPNGLGLFFAFAIPFALHFRAHAQTAFGRFAATVAMLVIATGLLATFSRGAWLSAFLGAGVLFLAGGGRRVLRIWGAVVLGALVVNVLTRGAISDTFVRTIGDWVVEQRAALALAGLTMFADHPLVGVGPGGFAVMLEHYGAQITALWDYQPTPHNVYIELGAETGFVGLASYIAFLGLVLRTHVRGIARARARDVSAETSVREAAAWAVAVGVCSGMAITPFAHGTGQLLALAIAVGCAVPEDA